MWRCSIVTFAVSIQGCTSFQQPPAAKRARMTDTVGAKSLIPATANPQLRQGWSLDATAVTAFSVGVRRTQVRL
ncbi:hypothetical protein H6G97_46175 [Nostoc flagelliforme FACHB-838]|uniref:Uncharacterized protein n=1 Tax=Nostoc flagelliforme FACHB-838 TaxID=2692904 RepID=A0ABR8E3L5_9NOSO|nr:hypothetical protein [Nostoc flagelliforme]MBD2536289.1 hypothetical protein [Nostoc flagelliforme FACHB-838]